MFVSARNFFTKYLPVLAYTLQSSVLRSSPGLYLRCSENSTLNPWNGLLCSPLRNPSTMNFARRSSRATWRITSGRRYFSAFTSIRGGERQCDRQAYRIACGLDSLLGGSFNATGG